MDVVIVAVMVVVVGIVMATTAVSSTATKRGASVLLEANKKRQKMNELNSNTVQDVLTQLSKEEFVKYMLDQGPNAWKHATDYVLSVHEAKTLIVMIIERTQLTEAFAVYLSLYEAEEEKVAKHIFELGLGNMLKQRMLPNTPKNSYLKYMLEETYDVSNISPLLPELKHKQHYFCLNKNFAKTNGPNRVLRRLNPDQFKAEELFFMKLCSSVTCASTERWSECFAHGLSALDVYTPQFSYLHDVLCWIALAACKMSVSVEWCCKVLEEARYVSTSVDHSWRRLLVFQALLLQNGLFGIEQELYTMLKPLILKCSFFYQVLLLQHLQGLMAKIENNLVFQYVRQNFHMNCSSFCEKDPCIEKSFAATQKLLCLMDKLAQKLPIQGKKEYFMGYYYLYCTMTQVHKRSMSRQDTLYIQLAETYFLLARQMMNREDPMFDDLEMIIKYVTNKHVTMDSIDKHFSVKTMTKYNAMASHFCFRAMLIHMYWENTFQPISLQLLMQHTRELENNVTNGNSYRNRLLNSCVKISDGLFEHTEDKEVTDYPILTLNEKQKIMIAQARENWQKEKTQLATGPCLELDQSRGQPNAKHLLQKNSLAEQVYAFGYQLTEYWTRPNFE